MLNLIDSLSRTGAAEEAVSALIKKDKRLGQLIERAGPFALEIEHMQTPFDSLAEAIIYQQLTGKAAATILSRIRALFPHSRFPTPDDILKIPEDALRGAGASRAKIAALKDLAEKTKTGMVPSLSEMERLSDEELVRALVAIRGIGRWTVEMMLIFRLGRPDVFPSTDYGIRKGFGLTYRIPDLPLPKYIEEYAERWRPYRTIASWYLWRAVELAKPSNT